MTSYKEYRINNELTQKEMADKLNISLNAYRNYELGKRLMPYNTLAIFLKMRNVGKDMELSKILIELENNNER